VATGDDHQLRQHCGRAYPRIHQVFTSSHSKHVHEIVTASREGGASLTILSGLVAGYFSAVLEGALIAGLMGGAFFVSKKPRERDAGRACEASFRETGKSFRGHKGQDQGRTREDQGREERFNLFVRPPLEERFPHAERLTT